MKKKIISMLLTAAMLNISASAAVIESVSEDTKNGTVTVTGTGMTAGEEVVIEIFACPEGQAPDKTNPEFIGVFNADENGAYSAGFRLPDNVETGEKEVFVKPFILSGSTEKFMFYSAQSLETVISEWNRAVDSASADTMENLINSESAVKILMNSPVAEKISKELAAANKSALAAKLLETGKTDSIEDASAKFLPLYINFAVNNLSPQTCSELTAEFYDYIDTSKGDVYTDILADMADAQRSAVYTAAAERISGTVTNDEFTALIYEEAVMEKFKSIEYYGDINPYMQKYNSDYFKLDFTEYNKLKNTYPVDSKVINQKASYKTFAELKTLFDRLVSEQKSSEQKSQSQIIGSVGGSGGGSGSRPSSSKTTYSPVIAVTEKIEEETVFDDLVGYEWAESYIMQLYGKNVVNGTGDKKFSPADSVTREQFIKLLSPVAELPESTESSGFEDVKAGEWYESYINAAKQAGLVNGISDTLFGIGQKITRQDAAVMMLNAIKLYNSELLEGINTEGISFEDQEDIASYAIYSVTVLNSLGIIQGMDDGKFYPQAYANRAEAAVMIGRILEFIG